MNFEAFAWYVETGVEIFPGLVRLPLRDRTGGRIVEDAGALRPIRLVREFLIGVSATQRGLFRGQGRYVKFILSGGVAP